MDGEGRGRVTLSYGVVDARVFRSRDCYFLGNSWRGGGEGRKGAYRGAGRWALGIWEMGFMVRSIKLDRF